MVSLSARIDALWRQLEALGLEDVCPACGHGNPALARMPAEFVALHPGQRVPECHECGSLVTRSGRYAAGGAYVWHEEPPREIFAEGFADTPIDGSTPGHIVEIKGGNAKAFKCRDPEFLVEGPANTGKSFMVGHRLRADLLRWPGSRVLALRQTRASLTESWLVTWEEKVLGAMGDHYLLDGAQRNNRTSYEFNNGSLLVPGGMDNASRYYSSEWDEVFCEEAFEFTLDSWEKLARAARYGVMPHQIVLGCTNPDTEGHWLNKRCEVPVCPVCEERVPGATEHCGVAPMPLTTRIRSRHVDNPGLLEANLRRLKRLSGVRRSRLYIGEWISAEGQVWDNFSRPTHVIAGRLEQNSDTGRWWLHVPAWEEDADRGRIELEFLVGSLDWGYRNPGVFQVWGVDRDRRCYRIAEIYRREVTLDQWCEWIKELHGTYDLAAIFADSAEPRSIDLVNDFLGWPRGRKLPGLVVPADKTRRSKGADRAGLDLVRDLFEVREDGRASCYYVAGAFPKGLDPVLQDDGEPACTEDEIGSYIWRRTKDGQPDKEEPDPLCADHGCDATIYMANGVHKRNLARELPKKPKHRPGTWGDIQDRFMLPL